MKHPDQTFQITVLEDDASFVDTLRLVLELSPSLVLTQAFRNPVHFLGQLPQITADVFLLDICLPKLSGLDCLSEVRRLHPSSRILMMSVSDADDHILRAFLDGADGYLLKDGSPDQICASIEEVLKGGAPMPPSIARKVIRLLGKIGNGNSGNTPQGEASTIVEKLLSPREFEILQLLADGHRYADIARKLHVSHDTVKTHIRHIYEKLHVRNKAEAVSRLLR
ncbi:MAG: response regulator transcription factor [Verrucomicrobiales bacterium]